MIEVNPKLTNIILCLGKHSVAELPEFLERSAVLNGCTSSLGEEQCLSGGSFTFICIHCRRSRFMFFTPELSC